MKRRMLALFFKMMYIIVLAVLLMIHVQSIVGTVERYMAMLEILLLVLAIIPIHVASVKWKNKEYISDNASVKGGVQAVKVEVRSYEDFLRLTKDDNLSERENEVAWLIYRGFTNRQIGEELFIAETTVKKHVSHIFEKAGVSGRKELKEKWKQI